MRKIIFCLLTFVLTVSAAMGNKGTKTYALGDTTKLKVGVRVFKANNGDVMAEATFRNVSDSTIKLIDMLDSSIFVNIFISGRFEGHEVSQFAGYSLMFVPDEPWPIKFSYISLLPDSSVQRTYNITQLLLKDKHVMLDNAKYNIYCAYQNNKDKSVLRGYFPSKLQLYLYRK